MGIAIKASKLVLVGTAAWLVTAGASAQTDPEGGDVGAGAAAGGSVSAGGQFGSTAPTPPPTTEPAADPVVEDTGTTGGDDHEAVVERLGVGFFGVQTLPLLDPGMVLDNQDLSAPTIGARYWLNTDLAIEAALGLAIGGGDFEPAGGPNVSSSSFGLALHGGVPIALAHSGHFVFEVIPVINFGIASGSIETTAGMTTATTDLSGLLIELGAKVGAEIHFGFIDLPDLALVGSLGLTVRHESRSIEVPAGMGTATTDRSATLVSTGVDGEPWDIFTGNIAAIYYL
jgi:hypothetical protein